jgi:hypothetical protein
VEILFRIYAKCLDRGEAELHRRNRNRARPSPNVHAGTPALRSLSPENLGTYLAQTPGDDHREPDITGHMETIARLAFGWSQGRVWLVSGWCPRQDSNLRHRLRRAPFKSAWPSP